jgi:hypothetical protein
MSANPKPDLQQVKTIFESFRSGRLGKQKPRLPENLWAAAVGLLDHYSFDVVRRELRLKPDYLRKRAEAAKGGPTQSVQKKPGFLKLTGHELTAIKNGVSKNVAVLSPNQARAECRLVIERSDGSRLLLNLPVDGFSQTDWPRIEGLFSSFLRA